MPDPGGFLTRTRPRPPQTRCTFVGTAPHQGWPWTVGGMESGGEGLGLRPPPSAICTNLSAQPSLTGVHQGVQENLVGAGQGSGTVKHADRLRQGHRGEGGVVGGQAHTGQLGLQVHTSMKQEERTKSSCPLERSPSKEYPIPAPSQQVCKHFLSPHLGPAQSFCFPVTHSRSLQTQAALLSPPDHPHQNEGGLCRAAAFRPSHGAGRVAGIKKCSCPGQLSRWDAHAWVPPLSSPIPELTSSPQSSALTCRAN